MLSFLYFILSTTGTHGFLTGRAGTGLLRHCYHPSHHNMVASSAAELVSGSIPWHSLVGQADRALRLGIQLEKNGQARRSSAAFHEAVTLYQCFLDSRSDFKHVTSLPDDEAPTILAYACLRLGFLSFDALGDAKAAVRLYKEAADLDPVSRYSLKNLTDVKESS
jgi:hypothetical protein